MNTPFEAIGSGGFGIAVMALCSLGGAPARNVLYPVAAAGSMSLSAYSLHIVIVAFHTDWVGGARWTPLLGPYWDHAPVFHCVETLLHSRPAGMDHVEGLFKAAS